MIGRVISNYRITGELGSGGMGVVYRAEDTRLGKEVAIKLATGVAGDRRHSRLLEEARAACVLTHPNVAQIYYCGEDDGTLFVVMELVRGRTLHDLLKEGPLDPVKAIRILEDTLSALGEAHRYGIVHRDVKPSNIMIDERGTVKVLDFGLAKRTGLLQNPTDSATDDMPTVLMSPGLTLPGEIMGTPAYMSPEQMRDEEVDGRSDLFACGVLLYRCLTGQLPFRGRSSAEVLGQVLHVSPEPPSRINTSVQAGLDAIVMKALAKDTALRFQTAGEMREQLRQLRETLSGSTGLTVLAADSAISAAGAKKTLADRVRQLIPQAAAGALALLAAVWYFFPVRSLPVAEARRWYQQGLAALQDGTYLTAAEALKRVVEADGGFALGHARRAEALAELDQIERAQTEMLLALRQPAGWRRVPADVQLELDAVQALLTRDYRHAADRYRELVDAVPADEKSRAWLDLGRALERAPDGIGQAVNAYGEAIRLDPQYAAAFLRRGSLHAKRGKWPEAEADFAKAESIYSSTQNLEGLAEVDYQMGYSLIIPRLPDARARLERCLQRASSLANDYQAVRAMLALTAVTYREGRTQAAQDMARQAVDRARRSGMGFITAWGLTDLGNAQLAKSDLMAARATLEEAVAIATESKLPRTLARARLSLGSSLMQAAEAEAALPHIEAAREFYSKNGFPSELLACRMLISRAHRSRGEYAKASESLEEALNDAKAKKDTNAVSGLLGELANLNSYRERYADALRLFRERYALVKDSRHAADVGFSMTGETASLASLGDLAGARAALRAAEERFGGADAMAIRLAELRRTLLMTEGNWREAAAAYQQAIKAPVSSPDVNTDYRIRRLIALVRSGQPREARAELPAVLERIQTQTADLRRRTYGEAAAALVYQSTGDFRAALSSAQRVIAETGRLEISETVWRTAIVAAAAAQESGTGDQAAKFLEQADTARRAFLSRLDDAVATAYEASPEAQWYRRLETKARTGSTIRRRS